MLLKVAEQLVGYDGIVVLRHPAPVMLSWWNRAHAKGTNARWMRERAHALMADRTDDMATLIAAGWRVFRYVDIVGSYGGFASLTDHIGVGDVFVTEDDLHTKVDPSPKRFESVDELPNDIQNMIRSAEWLAKRHNIPLV